MTYPIGHNFIAVLLLALVLGLVPLTARAEMEVLESGVPGIQAGSKLPDDAQLKLPQGATLRLLLEDGNTATLQGPYEGTASDYQQKKAGWWQRLFGGDDDKTSSTIGATRGLR